MIKRDEIQIARDAVRDAVASGRFSKISLATQAGVHRNSLVGIEREDWNPTSELLRALLRVVRARPLPQGANQRSVAA